MKRAVTWTGVAAGGALAVAWPLIADNQWISVGSLALTFLVLGQALNLVYGYAGYLCLGITVFWAVGAFTTARLVDSTDIGTVTAILLGALLAGLVGLVVGLVAMPRGRDAFVILTLVLVLFAAVLARGWRAATGGTQGIAGLPVIEIGSLRIADRAEFYWATLAIALVVLGTFAALVTSRWGRTLRASRSDELLAASVGVNLTFHRVLALVVAAIASGLIGGVHVLRISVADPSLLSLTFLAPLFAIVYIGGPGNFLGVTVAAIVVTAIPELFRELDAYRNLLYGGLLLVAALLFPQGLPAAVRSWTARLRRHPPAPIEEADDVPARA
ncbi:branched-chain amino acid ABC transporter permease [Micromonospora sp. NPDC000316]|uniref:branched-chain amino acid ABC transporter permease n=1 Tax=Micromonospora sp. NPDC000316 TaxID=3364216 RepID=UPI0036A80FF4